MKKSIILGQKSTASTESIKKQSFDKKMKIKTSTI